MFLDEVNELFKTFNPFCLLILLPLYMIILPTCPVSASYEFQVYRMQQYDLNGVPYGSRGLAINLEAKAIDKWSSPRHCVISHLTNITIDKFRNLKNKAGALLIVFPENFWELPMEEKQHLFYLENQILSEHEVPIPVYFSHYDPIYNSIITELDLSINVQDKSKSAAEAIFFSVTGNGYQVTVSPDASNNKVNNKITSIHGHLVGQRSDLAKVPTIILVAYYDAFGITPELSFGIDSNGSGVIILLELIRIFSELYSDPKTRGKYNLIFMLSGGGKFNYQGSRKWLEEQLDSGEGSLIQDTSFVICLDTLASSDTIYMHVSKPPKQGAPAQIFYEDLKTAASSSAVSIEGIHKKINLADDLLAWEHERYSMRRLSAFTLSSIKNAKDPWRSTILDTKENLNVDRLIQNAKIITNALGKFIFEDINSNKVLEISKVDIQNSIKIISAQPRSAQLLTIKGDTFLPALQQTLKKYLGDVKVTHAVPDKRDPDFQFYGSTSGKVNIYRIKPAIFDLFVTFVIAIYLGGVFLVINFVPNIYNFAYWLLNPKKTKSS